MRPECLLILSIIWYTNEIESQSPKDSSGDNSYNIIHRDKSYEFGYANRDRGSSYHFSDATGRNVVRGRYGSRNPGTGRIDETQYTAGPRGYRPRGPNVHRKYDLNQNGPRPIGSRDDPYFDPSEDPSYSFGFRTRTYNKQESANRNGDVTGRYSYLDDVGERHNVEYIAGKNTGFHVKTPYPDSNPRAYGPLYYIGRGKKPRGHTSIQRGLDGSYRFVAAGPDQRRTETSDSAGNVRGSYTYLDDKGKQHVVHYIAGPNIGYRVLKNPKDYPTLYPFAHGPPLSVTANLDPYDDTPVSPSGLDDFIFDGADENLNTAASGHVKPKPNYGSGTKRPPPSTSFDKGNDDNDSDVDENDLFGDNPNPNKGNKGDGGSSGQDDIGDIFNGSSDDFGDSDNVFGDKRPPGYPPKGPSTGNYPFGDKAPGGGTFSGLPGGRPTGSSGGYPSGRPGGARPSGGKPGGGGATSSEDGNQDGGYSSSEEKVPDLFGGTDLGPKPTDGTNIPGHTTSGRPGSGARPTGGARPGYRPGGPIGPVGGNRPGGGTTSSDGASGDSDCCNDSTTDGYGGSGGSSGSSGGDDDIGTALNIFPDDDDYDHNKWRGKNFATILRNLGTKDVNLPPGIAVRAHVQSIDILPFGSRLPSPRDQYDSDESSNSS